MNVGRKLMLCIGAILAVVFSLAGAWWYSNQTLTGALKFAAEVLTERAILAGELRTDVVGLREKQRGILMYALAHDLEHSRANETQFEERLRDAKAELAGALRLSNTPKERQMLATVGADLDVYTACIAQVSSLVRSGRLIDALKVSRETGVPIADRLEKETFEYVARQKDHLTATEATAATLTAYARWSASGLIGIGITAVVIVAMVVRRITRALRSIASSMSDGVAQIAAGSNQISVSSQTLAQGASEQAASLEQTSASAEEITAMTRQNAANTNQVAQLMATVDRRVMEGNSTLATMIESMQQINTSSGKISKIIKVIDEIAFQTNILALNAAVEAARAGEAGMGFAVVADEVRNLAQRSAQAAKDTASLIEESIASSHEGSARVEKVAGVVAAITEATGTVKVLVDEVNIGSQEQAKGIEEIARFLTEMDKVTQQNAAASEESATASEQMAAQAQSFSCLVGELRTMAGTAA
jgi:methyl-accepting chemotaxis protein/methyl-accepting chemotaxis protein-1 (serine sensor receptor)